MFKTITSPANPSVKRMRSLHEKKHRQAEGLFIAEGLRIVAEAMEAGAEPAVLLFGGGARDHPLLRRLARQAQAAGAEVAETTEDILNKISHKDNPQMVLGAFRQKLTPLAELDRTSADIWLALQDIRDPGNLGTILRLGDGVGAGGVILLDHCCDPFSTEAVRASMGALFTQKIATASGPEFLRWLRQGPGQLVGAALDPRAADYQAVRYAKPCFLLMGNEQAGLPPAYLDACDALAKIPMRGKADSLNVALACAVMAYEVLNQFRR